MFGIMNALTLIVCEDADEAIAKGFDYNTRNTKPVEITEVVVVNKGTEEGNPTVDFVMRDQEGNEYVVMVTGRLIKMIPCGSAEDAKNGQGILG